MIVGYDWGNRNVKLCTNQNVITFPSMLIPYRKQKVQNTFRTYDFIYEYNGRKGLAGTLAEDEQTVLDRNRKGDTKLHESALIRLLIGLHQFADHHVDLVVGQPINRHSEDKRQIIEMVKGKHTITVNGITKEVFINRVLVGVEGGSALLSNLKKGLIHVIDIGSGTINFATSNNGRFINNQSDTIAKGIDNAELEGIKYAIENTIIDLGWNGDIYLTGGGAYQVKKMLPYDVLNPTLNGRTYGTEFANAIGFYKIGEQYWKV